MRLRSFAAILVLSAFVSACGDHVSISELNQNPQAYEARKISTSGVVGPSSGLFGLGAYVLQGDGGELVFIITDRGLPPSGNQATVNGVFKQIVALNERSYAVVFENEHINFDSAVRLMRFLVRTVL